MRHLSALLQALMDQGLLRQHQIQQMLDENEGKYQGSQLQEMLNQLIERLVDEGYLTLHEEPTEQRRDTMGMLRATGEVDVSFDGANWVPSTGGAMAEGAINGGGSLLRLTSSGGAIYIRRQK